MAMETFVRIDGMRMHAFHGVLPQERSVGNDYELWLKVGYPWHDACKTDDVADTLNYAELSELVKRQMAIPSNLLEHVAGRIVEDIRATFPKVTSIELRLMKIAPPMACDCLGAGVEVCFR